MFFFFSYSLGQFAAICMVHLHRQLVLFDAKYKGSSANAKLRVGSKRPSLQPWLHNVLYTITKPLPDAIVPQDQDSRIMSEIRPLLASYQTNINIIWCWHTAALKMIFYWYHVTPFACASNFPVTMARWSPIAKLEWILTNQVHVLAYDSIQPTIFIQGCSSMLLTQFNACSIAGMGWHKKLYLVTAW